MSDQLTTAPAGGAPAAEDLRPAGSPPTSSAAAPRGSVLAGILRAARPRQWVKNVLLLAAPGAAGVLDQGPALREVALAFVAFCLVASGTYLLNDVRDAESDRAHPRKRRRPVAAGVVAPRTAVGAGGLMLLAGLALAAVVNLGFLAVAAGYLVLTTAYTVWLRHVAVLDIATVASFFIIRAVAGGVAAEVPLSRWFLIVASFGSLFIVAGKRLGEHAELGVQRSETRTTLGVYPLEYLREVRMIAAGVAMTAYCLWAFEQSSRDPVVPFFELTIVPFVLFVLRYALLAETDRESAPEDLVLSDRPLQAMALAWVVLFACGVHLGG